MGCQKMYHWHYLQYSVLPLGSTKSKRGAFKCLYASPWGKHGLVHAVCEVQALHKKQNNGLPSHKTHPVHQDEHDFENDLVFVYKKKKKKKRKGVIQRDLANKQQGCQSCS